MSQPDLHHLSAAYALDALDAEERQAFEAHYPTCEICTREVAEFRATAAVLASEVAVEPSPDLRDRIMGEVSRTRQLSPLPRNGAGAGSRTDVVDLGRERQGRLRTSRIVLGAAAAVLVVVAGLALLQTDPAGDIDGDLARVVAAPDAEVTALDPGPDTGAGGEDGSGRSLRVVWSRERGEVAVFGNDLVAAGPGSTYELWLLSADGGASPAGLFQPDEAGTVRVLLALALDDGVGWGVTIEPDGGSDAPTPPILFSGQT